MLLALMFLALPLPLPAVLMLLALMFTALVLLGAQYFEWNLLFIGNCIDGNKS